MGAFLLALAFQQAQTPMIDQLDFLSGHWRANRGSGVVDEVWMPPSGGSMLGMSRTVRDGTTRFTEFFHVSVVEGKLKMKLAQGLGSPPLDFTGAVTPNRVVFASTNDPNKATIEYVRNQDKLSAVVKGEREGQPYTLEFHFERVK